VLYALMDKVVDRYFPVLEARNRARIDRGADSCAIRALQYRGLVRFEGQADDAQARGRPADGSGRQALRRRVPRIRAGMGEYFRDVFDHLQRLHASIEGIRDMQATAIQVNLGMINLNETEVTKKLAGWAAIIAMPTLIAGIYGMNFKFIPEYDFVYGYPLSLAMMVAVDVALYFWFKKIRWL
jgi:magnesium transporter